ncbi:MAG: glycosyltransferase family 39 protein [Phycisphaerae bacterium]|nr:glycosyltransferase family 39 protein [Phycisphaerae bacterium]
MSEVAPNRREIVLLFVILLAGLAVRLYFFGGLYASDDMRHAFHSYFLFQQDNIADADTSFSQSWCYRRMGVNLPLAFVMWLFGPKEWAMASVPLIASLASIVATFALLRRIGGRIAGLLGAGMCAFLPIDIYESTTWLQDNIFVCAFALCLLCLVLAHESIKHRVFWGVLAGLSVGYMQICKETACLMIGVIAIWSLLETWKTRHLHLVAVYALGGFVLSQALLGLLFLALNGSYLFYIVETAKGIYNLKTNIPTRYTLPQIIEIFTSYLFDRWLFGFAAAALPVTAALMFSNRRNKYRVLIALVFLLQLYVLREAMRWTPGQTRYMLQITLPIVLITVLGVCSLLQRLPSPWRVGASVVTFAGVVLSGWLALDGNQQQYNRAKAECLRRTLAYLCSNAGHDEPIYVYDRHGRGSSRTKSALYVLNGFQRIKGGFRSLDEAYEAESGWVLLSCYDENAGVAPHWMEVYRCFEGTRWARVFRILPERPSWAMRVLPPSERGMLHLPPPEVNDQNLVSITFDEPAEHYRSHWCGQAKTITFTKDGNALSMHAVASASAERGIYAGVHFPTRGTHALRLMMSFTNPADIKAVFVDGQNAKGQRVARWFWRPRGNSRPPTTPETYTLVTGEATGYFRPVGGSSPDGIVDVHVFLQVRSGCQVGLVLHDVAIVPDPS